MNLKLEIETASADILNVCRLLYARNMLAAADGNISVRLSDDSLLITPSGRHKAFLNESDLCRLSLDGTIISGKPSSERLMHLAVYQKCPLAKAVVHAHPPCAIAWSVARPDLKELPFDALSEVILAVGNIPFVPYARPGTAQMGDVLGPHIERHRVLVLSRHGALSWGESIDEAYNGMERLEHSALILKYAQEIGSITPLPPEEIEFLQSTRLKLGPRSL